MQIFLQLNTSEKLPDLVLIIIAGTGLILFLSSLLLFILFTQQKKKLEKQKAIESVRTKISGDIHDEIGAGLTKISLMCQRLKMSYENRKTIDTGLLDRITASSKEIIGNLGEIIWTVNPKQDNLASLLAYSRSYAAHFFEETGTVCTIDFPEEIPERTIHPDIKRNLFLVLKESLNNILKHANATEVSLRFLVTGEQYRFYISDNGKGMDHTNGRDFGNGLINMRHRMEAISGQFSISSEKDKGTFITLAGGFQNRQP